MQLHVLRLREFVGKLLDPPILAPLVVLAALFLISGIFNVLYTCLHDAEQCAAAHARIGPVAGTNLQNTTEVILSFMSYAMIVYGLYALHGLSRRTRKDLVIVLALSLTLIIVGTLLLTVMFYAKR